MSQVNTAPPRRFVADAGALMASSAVNGALGLVFWAWAAHRLPVALVGRASTLIMAATTIAAISNFSMGPFFERFLPAAGRSGPRVIFRTHAAVALVATLLATAYLLIAPRHLLFDNACDMALFVIAVVIVGAFALQDSVLVGLLRGRWAAAKNIFHAFAKLALLMLVGTTALGMNTVLLAWVIPAAIAVAAAQYVIATGAGGLGRLFEAQARPLPPRRELVRECFSLYGIVLINALSSFVVTLLVVTRLGVEQAAYFGVAWTLVSGVALLLSVINGPFVARAAARPEDLPDLIRRQTRLLTLVALAGAAALALAAPLALRLLGHDYPTARPLLLLMAVMQPLMIPAYLFAGLSRVLRRLDRLLLVQGLSAFAVIAATWLLLPVFGITAVGIAYVTVELAVVVAVLGPIRSMLREVRPGVPSSPPARCEVARSSTLAVAPDRVVLLDVAAPVHSDLPAAEVLPAAVKADLVCALPDDGVARVDVSRPAVDVVVPLHNSAAFVVDCVAALGRQTRRPARVVIVDDESTDGGADLAIAALTREGLLGTLVRIDKRAGAGAARNRGLAVSTAELVWFVDADDTIADDGLEILCAALGEHDFVACRTTFIAVDGQVLGVDESVPPATAIGGRDFARLLLVGAVRAYPTTKLFRRAMLGERPWDEVRRYEDMAAMLALSLRARSIGLVAAAPYRYRQHAASASKSFDPVTLELLELPDRVRERARAAGYRPAPAVLAAFVFRESVLPLANLAIRAQGGSPAAGELAQRAVRSARDRIAVRGLVLTVCAGQPRIAAAALVLKSFPGLYARVLRRR